VPVLLPPVYFDVRADNGHYQEMPRRRRHHARGLHWPARSHWDCCGAGPGTGDRVQFYVIATAESAAEYMIMEPRTVHLASTPCFSSRSPLGVGDLYRIYVRAQREQAGYHAAWIGTDFDAPWRTGRSALHARPV